MSYEHQSLLKAFQYHVLTRPEEKVLLIPKGTKYEEVNFQTFNNIINKYANYWKKQLENENLEKNSVISYLSQSGPEYLYNIMALWKLGFITLLLSPRNSESNLVHLLQEAKSRILIYDSQFSKISKNVQNELNHQYSKELNTIFQLPNNLEIENIDCSEPDLKSNDDDNVDSYEKIIAIFHSSGSTSFPKLVSVSSRYFLIMNSIDKSDDIILSIFPLFHVFGFITVLRTILNPGSVYVFTIIAGSIPLANEVLNSLNQSKANVLYTIPSIVEQIHKNYPDEIKLLSKLRAVYSSGAALSNVGEQLINSGVQIQTIYGSTEIGVVMNSIKDSSSSNVSNIPWNAMRFLIPENDIRLIERNDILDGAKELIVKKGASTIANIIGTTDDDYYRVGDLFIETPKNSGYYILLGRVDDIIVHTTGEKTNPVPIENTILLNQFVKHVVVIGNNKPLNCLLIELDYESIKNIPFLEITKSIFDSIHQANNDCLSYSRIFDEMVYILPLEGKLLPRTLKNNIQRKKVEIEFKEEIEKLYYNFENRKFDPNNGSLFNYQLNEDSVKTIVLNSLKLAIGDSFSQITEYETSFFALGLDSLSAIKLRGILQKQFSVINLPDTIIFEYSTVQSLTNYLKEELSKQHFTK
ncbi:acetyl-CoA synthetase-like protein [Gigaspora margarita]|uniref:Acetyl-CoA synthetase-like protein n=1 Tax=Gigaspora margarita TaxID=4874 RepID=A0A8H3XJR1_GIGMA|nr:acetyl-CoA synthetase-like protein [Gigaspora margarita]